MRSSRRSAAAPGFLAIGALVTDLQSEFLGERSRHDDERQAVAGARVEGLRRVARDGRVVVELQLALVQQRFDQAELHPVRPELRLDLRAHVVPHRVAQGKDLLWADLDGGLGKQLIVEKVVVGWGCLWRRGTGHEKGAASGSNAPHRSLEQLQPRARGLMETGFWRRGSDRRSRHTVSLCHHLV